MGARGRLPNQDRETTTTRHEPTQVTPGGLAPEARPRPPAHLLPEAKKAWEAFWTDSALSALIGPSDVDLVLRWAGYLNALAKVRRALADADVPGKETVMDVQRLEKLVLTLEAAIGIGPAARARLGLPRGAKTAGDRAREVIFGD
jgi:phage terminase small subunit